MRTHVIYTEKIIAGLVSDGIFQLAARHYEKLDGGGYPHGLAAPKLTLPSGL